MTIIITSLCLCTLQYCIGVFIVVLLSKFTNTAALFYLNVWTDETIEKEERGENISYERNIYHLNIFTAFSMGAVFWLMCRTLLASAHGIGTGRKFHKLMLSRVLQAPVSFFDVTPAGRIINKFTGDLALSDQGSSAIVSIVITLFVEVCVACITVVVVTSGTFAVLLVPLIVLYYQVQVYFRRTGTYPGLLLYAFLAVLLFYLLL